MPTTHYSEAALERRREKFAYAEEFPGLLKEWREVAGKTVEAVAVAEEARVVLFTDGCFLVARPGPAAGEPLMAAIESVREALRKHRPEALDQLDRLAASEREAMRLARMEKVLGAVETNLPQVPELREELRRLLETV
jgi:diglucosylglycerate octanoyltransferase